MSKRHIYSELLLRHSHMPAAVCACHGWELLYINQEMREIFPVGLEESAGESFLHYLRGNGFLEVQESARDRHRGELLAIHPQGGLCVLPWRVVHSPDILEQPVRLLQAFTVPVDAIQRMGHLHWHEVNMLIDSIHDGIWVIDSEGTTLRVNKAMERISGVRAEEVVGKHVTEPMKLGLFRECVTLRALAERRVVSMFDDYANGKRCLNTSTPLFDEQGHIWRVVASIRDMTELESLQHKLKSLEWETLAYKKRLLTMETQSDAGFVGHSQAIRDLRDTIAKAGRTGATTLILGDTGTGKTLTAKAIHQIGSRAKGPFVSLSCGAIPENLIESELFGYDSGAFTGAARGGKQGMFDLAHGGTLLLDEIGELPLSMQTKLLQVLDEHTFYRVGGTRRIQVDVHILAATNKDLTAMVTASTFREDLYYRLRVITLRIPPLRDRVEDIPSLAAHFLEDFNIKNATRKHFHASVLPQLLSYPWPGNVRELRAMVQALASMADADNITEDNLPPYMRATGATLTPGIQEHQSLHEALEAVEKSLLTAALQKGGSTYKAAKILKISQSSVVRKAQRHKLNVALV